MKNLFILSLAVMFSLSLSVSLAFAGGDKVNGEKGQGGVNQYCNEPVDCPWE